MNGKKNPAEDILKQTHLTTSQMHRHLRHMVIPDPCSLLIGWTPDIEDGLAPKNLSSRLYYYGKREGMPDHPCVKPLNFIQVLRFPLPVPTLVINFDKLGFLEGKLVRAAIEKLEDGDGIFVFYGSNPKLVWRVIDANPELRLNDAFFNHEHFMFMGIKSSSGLGPIPLPESPRMQDTE